MALNLQELQIQVKHCQAIGNRDNGMNSPNTIIVTEECSPFNSSQSNVFHSKTHPKYFHNQWAIIELFLSHI